ncbi:MAG TPA: methyltransferase [Gammaproteobacteria bacterium]|jgi:predicted methyltransferase
MNRNNPLRLMLALGIAAIFAQTAQAQDEQVARMRAALASPERAAENKARDADRKPIESIQFFDIETGDTVVELVAAGGWFTEVLSAAVGPTGKVYASNPPFLVQGEAEQALHARLGNVQAVHAPLAEAGVVGVGDAALIALNLHDVYNGYGGNPGGEAVAVGFLQSVFAALKPGGVLGVIDHVGIAGQDNAALHRMLPQQARDALTKAGFTIEAESSMLANPADDHTKIVFDPAVRGHTDQFVFRARKPE